MPAALPRKAGLLLLAIGLVAIGIGAHPAGAAEAPVGLGTTGSFAVLGGSTVTNTGPTVVSGNLGVSPGTAVTGFPPGTVNNGTIHAADDEADQAQEDLTTAYDDAAQRKATAAVTADLGGQTLVPGVYSGPTLGLTGSLTLDAQGDPDAVFVFQAGSTLITDGSSVVALANGAQACNVFWQVGSSATLGTDSVFVGSVLALTSITANTGAAVTGRLLARNGAVGLNSNTITRTACAVAPTTTTSSSATPTTPTTGTANGDGTPVADHSGEDGANPTRVPLGTSGAQTPGGRTPSGATAGGSVPSLPATGAGLSVLTAMGLLAVGIGSVMSISARRRSLS